MPDRGWVDCHSHLSDSRWQQEGECNLQEAMAYGLDFFLQGGVGPEDWQKQKQWRLQYPQNIGLCFGLHPYWVAGHSESECEAALDQLATELPQAMALGEAGLDFRPSICQASEDRQLQVFCQQIELAKISHKPLVLHIVQAHDEALRCLDLWSERESLRGFVHSFNGSTKKAKDFLERGLLISVGGPLCRVDNQRLHQAVIDCPLTELLIETDSPDQPPPEWQGQKNPSRSLLTVAAKVAELKGLPVQKVLEQTRDNFWRLF